MDPIIIVLTDLCDEEILDAALATTLTKILTTFVRLRMCPRGSNDRNLNLVAVRPFMSCLTKKFVVGLAINISKYVVGTWCTTKLVSN